MWEKKLKQEHYPNHRNDQISLFPGNVSDYYFFSSKLDKN